jgi:hypothetical protein
LTPLPVCPLPPPFQSICAIRLPVIIEPSGPLSPRQMRTPALPHSLIRLPRIIRPRLSALWIAASPSPMKSQFSIVALARSTASPQIGAPVNMQLRMVIALESSNSSNPRFSPSGRPSPAEKLMPSRTRSETLPSRPIGPPPHPTRCVPPGTPKRRMEPRSSRSRT